MPDKVLLFDCLANNIAARQVVNVLLREVRSNASLVLPAALDDLTSSERTHTTDRLFVVFTSCETETEHVIGRCKSAGLRTVVCDIGRPSTDPQTLRA